MPWYSPDPTPPAGLSNTLSTDNAGMPDQMLPLQCPGFHRLGGYFCRQGVLLNQLVRLIANGPPSHQ